MRLLLGPHAAAVRSRRPPAAGRRTMNSSRLSGLVTAACAACVRAGDTTPARAWVYPEHRDIAVLAVNGLDPERRAAFDRLWGQARTGYEQRLCAHGADTAQALAPECIDWAAFSAISGDHSCSSRGMLDTVLRSAWILQVADVAAQLKVDLGRIAVAARPEVDLRSPDLVGDLQRRVEDEAQRAERVNALRTADTRMQRADPQYATRAGSNNAHFLIPRPSTDTTAPEYAQLALSPGSEVNAIGVYTWFHLSALQKAARIASGTPAPAARDGLARAMLADEGFALHFLEDAYASGHVAGTWGDVSQRKGTHDYYNEAGLEAFTWRGSSNSMVLMGDAHMRPEDAERASHAVRASLDQVLDTATGRSKSVRLADPAEVPVEPDALDVCKTNVFERRPEGLRATRDEISLLADVLGSTPVPGLGQGLGSLPRFRAEIGPFVGVTGTLDLRNVSRGLVPGEDANGWIAGAELVVVGQLSSQEQRSAFVESNRLDQERVRQAYEDREPRALLTLTQARSRKLLLDWDAADIPTPSFTGLRVLDEFPLDQIVPYIDWSPFFHAWEMRGRYPEILQDPKTRELFEDGQHLLTQIVQKRQLIARAAYGFFPANSVDDDIELYTDDSRSQVLTTFYTLRQQLDKGEGQCNLALADFIAPRSTGRPDYLGTFAVTAGHGLDALCKQYETSLDDYSSILAKALADRLAEAFAEYLHRRVRAEWGYGVGEQLTNEDLIRERYRGIRPAPGYPACPDHSEKRTLFNLLQAKRNAGIYLTDTCMMVPASSVSGLYFAHLEATYFAVGKIGRDRVSDYARRKRMGVRTVERWLAPNLDYDPDSPSR